MQPRKTLLTAAFAVALLIFVSIGWLTYRNMGAFEESDFWENHTYVVISQYDALLAAILDAQNAERGYLITGDRRYLDPYQNALRKVARARAALRSLTKDNQDQQKRLDTLDGVIESKLTELRVTIEAKDARGFNTASDMVKAHLSKNIMDRIRTLIEDSQEHERHLLQERSARKNRDMASATNALKLGSLVGFAILLTVFYLLNREVSQRSRAEAALLARNEELQGSQERERSQNWIKTGLNDLNNKLRGDRPLQAMISDAVDFLSIYLKAGVSALYLYDDRSQQLSLAAGFALPAGKARQAPFQVGEGAAGEAARLRREILLADLPPDYLVIGSGLGEALPRAVLALPLVFGERLVGVIEFGTFRQFSGVELDFLHQAAEALAIAISVNRARQQVDELLQQSQAQEEELRVQQEELQQTNEELLERAHLLEQQREQIQAKNREMEEATWEISRKARQVEQISSYKSEFLANMSHELRTPLNSLMILSGQLMENREGNLTSKQVDYAATIKGAGNELLTLINDILDLSKIESGRIEFIYEEVPVSELCLQLETTFRTVADQKELPFGCSIGERVPEKVTLDAQRTLQILKNLLSNAIKFTRTGSVQLHVYLPGRAESPLPVPALAFSVTDTGIGIPADKHELIFQAFQQADGSTSRRFGGTGLGLSISRQLARGMRGDIVVSSEEGKGSVFTLFLPFATAAALRGAPAGAPAAATGAAAAVEQVSPALFPAATAPVPDDHDQVSPGGRSILIVEDDVTFGKLLMERVREHGFAAIVATDGASAIELAQRYLPAAILLDVMLPGPDGWEVMQKLTENPRIRHIPVHFITCLEEKHRALGMGAMGFATKPVSGKDLDAILASIEEEVARTVKKLLIVEDDRTQAASLLALLEERDIAITVADSGAKAIELLSTDHFDCIVLDLGLADMSGFDLLEHIRTLDESRRIPVIIHTGQELSRQDAQRLHRYAESIIIKGAKSPERLLNEVTLFLHVMESKLPPEKQSMIRTTLHNERLLEGKKVLIADDDMRNIFSLSGVLMDKGMQVVEAENGKVALARLEEHPDIDVVLMDVMMPEMDGYEAMRQIRKNPRFSRLPIIALTAKAMKGDREDCLKAGASDYITKPVDMDRLLSLLRVWLYNEV